MIYLASPYSFNPQRGYAYALAGTHYLLRQRNATVYSPILHFHDYAKWAGDEIDAGTWWRHNRGMLRLASALVVYAAAEWRESHGVMAEYGYAKLYGINIEILLPDDAPWEPWEGEE